MELTKLFEQHLVASRRVSGKTLRNYRADLSHFLAWAFAYLLNHGITVTSTVGLLPYFNSQLISEYKATQLEKKTPESTTNRRLSTLRNFAKFLTEDGYIKTNPTTVINNLKPTLSWEANMDLLVHDFAEHLKKDGVSPITAKNYVSDVRQFLTWAGNGTGKN